MVKLSKRYRAACEAADLERDYPIAEAAQTLVKLPRANFDETVELSLKLGIDPRQGDQMVRGTVMLPHGSGKTVRVLALTKNPQEALDAGAAYAGLEEYLDKISEGWTDFDVAVATPEAMREARKVARILGPKGLMPNPKAGTVSDDLPKAIGEVKAGRVEFKVNKNATIAAGIAKRSFDPEQIAENAASLLEAVGKARPESFKGKYIRSAHISASMTPSVKIAPAEYAKY